MLTVLHPPAVEPLTVDEVKEHLRVDWSHEDQYIAALIRAARDMAESWTRRALITQTLCYRTDGARVVRGPLSGVVFPVPPGIILPRPPIQTVEQVRVQESDGTITTLKPEQYRLFGQTLEPVEGTWAGRRVEVVYKAGYGDKPEDVPPLIVQGMRLLIAEWYENRLISEAVPRNVRALWSSFRVWGV